MSKKTEMNDEDMEALMAEAELEAAADTAADELMEQEEEQAKFSGEEEETEDERESIYKVELRKEYEWKGKTVKLLDLSGLENLTTVDLEYADRVLSTKRHNPRNKYQDTTYQKHIAMRVTGLPVEFFNQLHVKDMLAVGGAVYTYFLIG